MNSFLKFFKDKNGELSSRRLVWIATVPFVIFGTFLFCYIFIHTNKADSAKEIWLYFLVYSGVIGGFVTVDSVNFFKLFKNGKK